MQFNQATHEATVREGYLRLERFKLFDELIDYALDGVVTLEQAITQYQHDAARLTADAQPSPQTS